MTRLYAICKTSSPAQIYSLHLKVCSTCPKEPNDCFPLETERFVIICPLLLTLQVRCSSDWARTRMQTPISISHSDCHSLSSNSNFIHGTTRVRASSFFFPCWFAKASEGSCSCLDMLEGEKVQESRHFLSTPSLTFD